MAESKTKLSVYQQLNIKVQEMEHDVDAFEPRISLTLVREIIQKKKAELEEQMKAVQGITTEIESAAKTTEDQVNSKNGDAESVIKEQDLDAIASMTKTLNRIVTKKRKFEDTYDAITNLIDGTETGEISGAEILLATGLSRFLNGS